MQKVMRKLLVLLLILALPLSLAACGGSDNGSNDEGKKNPVENNGAKGDGVKVLVVGEDIDEGDDGDGPVIISSRFGDLYIPDGFMYELDYAPGYDEGTDSMNVFVGEDSFFMTEFRISTTTNTTSYDTAIDYAIYWNGDEEEGYYEMGDEYKLGDFTFQHIYLVDRHDFDYNILASYYKTNDGEDAYVEINLSREMFPDDALLIEMFEKSKFK